MTDRRRLNKVWAFTNKLGERYIMGKVGSGKNELTVTLDYCGNDDVEQKRCLHMRGLQTGLMWSKLQKPNGEVKIPKIKKII